MAPSGADPHPAKRIKCLLEAWRCKWVSEGLAGLQPSCHVSSGTVCRAERLWVLMRKGCKFLGGRLWMVGSALLGFIATVGF